MCFFQLFPWVVACGFSFVLDPRGRLGGLGGKVGSAYKEFEDSVDGILG